MVILGLVLSDETYFVLTGHHCVCPAYLGVLDISNGTALHEAGNFCDINAKLFFLIHDTTNIEAAPSKKIYAAIKNACF